MKNAITFLMCFLCMFIGMAQTDSNGNQMEIPESTPELDALYQQARQLESTGTAAEINANRLAIKNAWQEVDPAVAALYKPVNAGNESGLTFVEHEISPQDAQPITRSTEDWSTDLLLRESYIDGLDMDVTDDGDIYIAAFENFTGGGSDSAFYIYRSQDGGNSFVLWQDLAITSVSLVKLQAISIDGNGDDYLLVYAVADNGIFQALRWNMATGDFEGGPVIANDVTDFSMDRNYVPDTDTQRVFATYLKEDSACSGGDLLYSARTTAGSYGFNWVDEANLGTCSKQVEFAYGHNGGCYATFIGGSTGNLYAKFNPNLNDPGSWYSDETIASGGTYESLNPTIRAARKAPASDKVLVIASQRPAGSSDHFDGKAYVRENSGSYSSIPSITTNSDHNIVQFDSWIRRYNDVESIQLSFVLERIDGTEDNINVSTEFDGSNFVSSAIVSDTGTDVFEGFPSAVAETNDNLPCMAFTGTSGSYGYGLYFDAKTETASLDNNKLQGVTVYPNPTKDILNLSTKNTVENVSIYSLLGQEVMQVSPQQKSPSLNVSSLASGIYVMKVEVDGQTGTYKIIKE